MTYRAAAALLLLPCVAIAADVEISVGVWSVRGQPIAGAKVVLEGKTGGVVPETCRKEKVTPRSSIVTFDSLCEGSLNLRASAPGYADGAFHVGTGTDESIETELELSPALAVKGRVVDDETGAPVRDLRIEGRQVDEVERIGTARTDDRGEFVISGFAPGDVRLRPRGWRFADTIPTVQAGASGLVFRLQRLPAAPARFVYSDGSAVSKVVIDEETIVTPNGVVHLPVSGSLIVSGEFAPMWISSTGQRGTADQPIVVHRAAKIRGAVTGLLDARRLRIQVTQLDPPAATFGAWSQWERVRAEALVAQTDERGRFELDALPSGSYSISAVGLPDALALKPAVVTLREAQTAQVALAAEPGGTLRVEMTGKVTLGCLIGRRFTLKGPSGEVRLRTDGEGIAVIGSLLPGVYKLEVPAHEGHPTIARSVPVEAGKTATEKLSLPETQPNSSWNDRY